MQVTPSGERPFPTPPTPNAPDLESARFANMDTVVLPDEMVLRILMNLGTTDIAVCRSVSRHWQTLIDTSHLLARSFYRDCHLTPRINSPAAQHKLTFDRYHSHIRDWLTNFGHSGRETAKQLDNILDDKYFPEVLFFSIPKLLLNSNELTYQNIATIRHLGIVGNASFSSDGKYLVVPVPTDEAAKLWELEGGQWREKFTLRHSAWVTSASFSPDRNHLVTASGDGICKIWRVEDDQWQEKATIKRYGWVVKNAQFSCDGKHLVTVCDVVKILWLDDDGQWQEKATIKHSDRMMTNAQFSPDGKHLVSTSMDGTVKIWKLDDGRWEEKFTIAHLCSCCAVINACFSPDGKHLVTVNSSYDRINRIDNATLLELVDVQPQENVTQQWQQKATVGHFDTVNDVHFSFDGKHLVTASCDGTVKICGLEGGNWQVKATIEHSGSVANASFSRNGKLLVTASRDGTAKICGLEGGKWQEIVTIQHCAAVTNVSFGPDDYQLVTTCDNATKIWVLKKKENDDNS